MARIWHPMYSRVLRSMEHKHSSTTLTMQTCPTRIIQEWETHETKKNLRAQPFIYGFNSFIHKYCVHRCITFIQHDVVCRFGLSGNLPTHPRVATFSLWYLKSGGHGLLPTLHVGNSPTICGLGVYSSLAGGFKLVMWHVQKHTYCIGSDTRSLEYMTTPPNVVLYIRSPSITRIFMPFM